MGKLSMSEVKKAIHSTQTNNKWMRRVACAGFGACILMMIITLSMVTLGIIMMERTRPMHGGVLTTTSDSHDVVATAGVVDIVSLDVGTLHEMKLNELHSI